MDHMPPAEIHDYADLHAVLRARAATSGLTRESIDHCAGLTRGHASKILCLAQTKRAGPTSLGALLGVLGLKLIAVDDDEAINRFAPLIAKHQRRSPRRDPEKPVSQELEIRAREIARQMVSEAAVRAIRARHAATPPAERSRLASVAASARWRQMTARQRQREIGRLRAARRRKRKRDRPRADARS